DDLLPFRWRQTRPNGYRGVYIAAHNGRKSRSQCEPGEAERASGTATRQKFALLPPRSKARTTVCDSRKLARVLKGKHDDCVLDRYKHAATAYLDSQEQEKLLSAQIDKAALMMGGEIPKCR